MLVMVASVNQVRPMSIVQPTNLDQEMLGMALDEARNAIAQGKAGVGAVLYWRSEILAKGHNQSVETGNSIEHAEMVVLREAGPRLAKMTEAELAECTMYTSLEPCLMCLSAISYSGLKRVAYSALVEDADPESMVVQGITTDQINDCLVQGPLELVPGVRREEGKEVLVLMGKASDSIAEPATAKLV